MGEDRTANRFILSAIQEWGQPENQRVDAVQAVLNAAGLNAVATCSPVFGGIWPKPCTGPDGERATAWLQNLTDTMKRGKYEREVEHVQNCIEAAVAAKAEGKETE